MKIYPVGEMSLSVDFGNVISEEVNDQVMCLQQSLQKACIPGILELLPTYRALLVRYDPAQLTYEQLSGRIEKAGAEGNREISTTKEKLVRLIPCCYGGAYGEDLKGMEALTGLSEKEIITIHSGTDYKIYMLGFLGGGDDEGPIDFLYMTPKEND